MGARGEMMVGESQIYRLTEQLRVATTEIQRLKATLEQGPSGWLCSQCHLNTDISGSRQPSESADTRTPTSTHISFQQPNEAAHCEATGRRRSTEIAQGDTQSATESTANQPLPARIFTTCNGASPADTASKSDIVDTGGCQQTPTIRSDPNSQWSSEPSRRGKKERRSKQRQEDPTSWTRYPRRHVALKVMYLGERYHGFASQTGSDPTVEGELLAALRRTKLMMTSPSDSLYSRCGRTDKGVNAHCQVIALFLRSKSHQPIPATATSANTESARDSSGRAESGGLAGVGEDGGGGGVRSGGPVDRLAMARASRSLEASTSSIQEEGEEIDYVAALNRALPADIRVMSWCPVPHGFSARFSCLWREYLYFFIQGDLDVEAMQDGARRFEGDHDFRNVCKMDATNVSNFRRRIERFTIELVSPKDGWTGCRVWSLRVLGSAFLWHQVRCMAAILLMVGKKQEAPTVVDDLLDLSLWPAKPQYAMAHEAPLVLHSCAYQGLAFRSPEGSASMVRHHVAGLRDAAVIKLAVLQTTLYSMGVTDNGEDGTSGMGFERNCRPHIPLARRPTERNYHQPRITTEIAQASTYEERLQSRSGKAKNNNSK